MGRKQTEDYRILIPSPSTMFNLACSDSIKGFAPLGHTVNLIGDSFAGKTVFALSILAEMARIKEFDNHKFIYNAVETIDNLDIPRMFGSKLLNRLIPISTRTIEECEKDIHKRINANEKFIYFLDSFDALTSEEEVKVKKDGRGSYRGVDKVRVLNSILRKIETPLKQNQSSFIVVSQTLKPFDPFALDGVTRAGGRKLKFHSYLEIWLCLGRKIFRSEASKKKNRPMGAHITVRLTKNKVTGKMRTIRFPIYLSYGVDDVESMIDFLCEEDVFSKGEKTIIAEPLGLRGTKLRLIKLIEQNNCESQLKELCQETWNEIEKSIEVDRKKKYE